MNAPRRTPAAWRTAAVSFAGRHSPLRESTRYIVESDTAAAAMSSLPTRFNSASFQISFRSTPNHEANHKVSDSPLCG